MLSDDGLSRYGLLENFNASVTRTGTGTHTRTGTHTGTGTWTTGVTAIALCTSCSRANNIRLIRLHILWIPVPAVFQTFTVHHQQFSHESEFSDESVHHENMHVKCVPTSNSTFI